MQDALILHEREVGRAKQNVSALELEKSEIQREIELEKSALELEKSALELEKSEMQRELDRQHAYAVSVNAKYLRLKGMMNLRGFLGERRRSDAVRRTGSGQWVFLVAL